MGVDVLTRTIGAARPSLSTDTFRQGMRRLAGSCTLLTSLTPGEGRAGWAGMTATAVASVTAEPPQLLVCINRSTWLHGIASRSGVIGINVLGRDALDMSGRFAGGVPPEEKFAVGDWQAGLTGAPLLGSSLVSFDCRISEQVRASTHDIIICDVVDVLIGASRGDPLIYFDGGYLAGRDPN